MSLIESKGRVLYQASVVGNHCSGQQHSEREKRDTLLALIATKKSEVCLLLPTTRAGGGAPIRGIGQCV